MGIPEEEKPHGIERHGVPTRLKILVNRVRAEGTGSGFPPRETLSSPIRGAVMGSWGVMRASTFSQTRSKFSRTVRRIRWALRYWVERTAAPRSRREETSFPRSRGRVRCHFSSEAAPSAMRTM